MSRLVTGDIRRLLPDRGLRGRPADDDRSGPSGEAGRGARARPLARRHPGDLSITRSAFCYRIPTKSWVDAHEISMHRPRSSTIYFLSALAVTALIAALAVRNTRRHEPPVVTAENLATATMPVAIDTGLAGDADLEFVAMMVPHHQGAIDMAMAELRHGHNEQLRRLAQEIIVTQRQEIALMRLAIGKPFAGATPASPTTAATAGR